MSTFYGHGDSVRSVAWPGASKLLTASIDREIKLWDLQDKDNALLWQPTIGRMVRYVRLEAEPLNIAWLNDGSRIVAACVDGHIRVVDADDVKVTQNLSAIEGWAYAIGVHPSDGSVAVGGSDGQLRRVNTGLAR